MNRCDKAGRRRALLALSTLAAAVLAAPSLADAQVKRNFPDTALRGKLKFTNPPDVVLNGQQARLSAGMRIRGANNMLVMTAAIDPTATFAVDYTLEGTGLIRDIWILTDDEARVKPWPSTQAEAQAWSFDYNAQTWTKP